MPRVHSLVAVRCKTSSEDITKCVVSQGAPVHEEFAAQAANECDGERAQAQVRPGRISWAWLLTDHRGHPGAPVIEKIPQYL